MPWLHPTRVNPWSKSILHKKRTDLYSTLTACFWDFCKFASSSIARSRAFFSTLASCLIIFDSRWLSLAENGDEAQMYHSFWSIYIDIFTFCLDNFRLLFLWQRNIGIPSSLSEFAIRLCYRMWPHGGSAINEGTTTDRKTFLVRENRFPTTWSSRWSSPVQTKRSSIARRCQVKDDFRRRASVASTIISILPESPGSFRFFEWILERCIWVYLGMRGLKACNSNEMRCRCSSMATKGVFCVTMRGITVDAWIVGVGSWNVTWILGGRQGGLRPIAEYIKIRAVIARVGRGRGGHD